MPEPRERLIEALAEADRVVVLGDLLELREQPVARVLDDRRARARRPRPRPAAASRAVVVPGNHDHHLADAFLDQLRLEDQPGPRAAHRRRAATPGLLGRLAELLPAALAEPGLPGHLAARRRLRHPRPPGRRAHDRPAPRGDHVLGHAPRHAAPRARLAGRLRGDRRPALLALPRHRPGLVAAPRWRRPAAPRAACGRCCRRGGLGGFARGPRGRARRRAGAEQRGLRPLPPRDQRRRAARLGPAGDGRGGATAWTSAPSTCSSGTPTGPGRSRDATTTGARASGALLHNTGSWYHEGSLIADAGPSSPYWPGWVTWLDDGGPPRLENVLQDVSSSGRVDGGQRHVGQVLGPQRRRHADRKPSPCAGRAATAPRPLRAARRGPEHRRSRRTRALDHDVAKRGSLRHDGPPRAGRTRPPSPPAPRPVQADPGTSGRRAPSW